jgi:hypothetical protein
MKIMDDTEQRGPGQPAHKPTKAGRESVRRWIAGGISEPVIAHRLGIVQNTLRTHYADDLLFGRDMKKADLLDLAYSAAKKGSVAAIRLIGEKNEKADMLELARSFGGIGQTLPHSPVERTEKLGKKEAALLAAQSPDTETAMGKLMAQRMAGAEKLN